MTWDALVAGAGPAGSATALLLARRGLRVALLERGHFAEPRVGESLAPAASPLLRELGVRDALAQVPHVRAFGCVSVWGDAEPASHSYLSNIAGDGIHVERSAFDRMLAEAARAAGAQLFLDSALTRCVREADGFRVTTRRADSWRARVLIDATGRRAQVARQLGAQSMVFDRAVAVAARWHQSADSHLLVESAAPGWFYSAPLADHMLSVMWMTDADLCQGMQLTEAIAQAPWTHARLRDAAAVGGTRTYCAHSQRLVHAPAAGPYLAVGDSALATDPIAGNGVVRALRSAHSAAQVAAQLLDEPGRERELLADYARAYDEQCTRYLLERMHYYAQETRFDSPYWQRRTHAVQAFAQTRHEAG